MYVEKSFQFSGDTVKIKDRRIFHNCNNFPLFLRESFGVIFSNKIAHARRVAHLAERLGLDLTDAFADR